MRRLTVALAAAAAVVSFLPETASAQTETQVSEWSVPWKGRTRDPYVAPDGMVWFVGQAGNYIARLDPKSGEFKRYEIAEGTNPHNLVVDPSGGVWFTGNRNGRIVQMDPATGKLTDYMMPDPSVRDPHTMIFDKAGNAWFTAQQSGVVGRLDAKTKQVRIWTTGQSSRPYGITVDPKGRVWFNLFGTNKLGMIDPAKMEVEELTLPNERTRARRIAVTEDGTIWYGDYTRGFLGRVDPATRKIEEFALPGGPAALPYAMAADDQGRIWLAETNSRPNRLVAFDPKTRKFTEIVPAEGGDEPNTIRHMIFDARSGSIWYGTDRNTIGRAKIRREKTTED